MYDLLASSCAVQITASLLSFYHSLAAAKLKELKISRASVWFVLFGLLQKYLSATCRLYGRGPAPSVKKNPKRLILRL